MYGVCCENVTCPQTRVDLHTPLTPAVPCGVSAGLPPAPASVRGDTHPVVPVLR